MATYDMTALSKSITISAGDILSFPYTGDKKSFNFPAGTYKLECWGAQGGSPYSGGSYTGGKGGYSYGTLSLNNSTNMYIYSGGEGNNCSSSSSWTLIEGGFNGGGNARSYNYSIVGSGGGASDIRIGQDSLYARVIVAGGGGGTGINNNYAGQCGGGLNGGGRTSGSGNVSATSYSDILATYGSQTSAGDVNCYQSDEVSKSIAASFGVGGFMYANNTSNTSTGGGGGGWYGGGCQNHKGGGGGSGYVYTSSTASNYPSGCLLNSSYYLTNASTIAGNTSFTSPSGSSETGHAGDGYVRVTVVSGGGKISVPKQSIITVKTFTANYTGSPQQVTLKKGQYKLECWGAQGGTNGSYIGGYGGYSVGTLTVTEKTQLYLYAGGAGSSSGTTAGYNGGGAGISSGRGGGGASDIRIGQDSLYARVIVAGGGGGAGVTSASANPAGCGGGLYGGDGYYNNTTGSYTTGSNRCGGSATQTAGGITWSTGTQASFGQGGNASGYSCGGGGGGWYGGGGAYDNDSDSDGRWGGGGSGYVYTSSTASNYPSGCLLNSSYYLTDASTTAGSTSALSPDDGTQKFNAGDGCVKITAITGGIVTSGSNEYKAVKTFDYSYTGTIQKTTLSEGIYKFECWGAQGGDAAAASYAAGTGGKGGYSSGILQIFKDTDYYIIVGGQGQSYNTSLGIKYAGGGGFGGGGAGGQAWMSGNVSGGAGGGGLSGIFSSSTYNGNEIIIAGGGGGGGGSASSSGSDHYYGSNGGAGGGLLGKDGVYNLCGTMTISHKNSSYVGKGGTQSAGGAATNQNSVAGGKLYGGGGGGVSSGNSGNGTTLAGGAAQTSSNSSSSAGGSGGGGGGYYGGSGGGQYGQGAGGGSGYVKTGLTTTQIIDGTQSFPAPSGSTETGHSGNGFVRITKLKPVSAAEFQIKANNTICTSSAAYIKVNGEWKEITDRYVKVNGSWVS